MREWERGECKQNRAKYNTFFKFVVRRWWQIYKIFRLVAASRGVVAVTQVSNETGPEAVEVLRHRRCIDMFIGERVHALRFKGHLIILTNRNNHLDFDTNNSKI